MNVHPTRATHWVAFSLAIIFPAFDVLVFLTLRQASPTLREQVSRVLVWLSPFSIKVLLVGLLIALAVNLNSMIKALALTRGILLKLLAITAFSGIVRLFIPFAHRVYYDEDVYLQIARSISSQGQALEAGIILIKEGLPFFAGSYPKWPNGWATLISLFSPHEQLGAFTMSYAASLGRIIVVGFVAWLLWSSNKRTLLAAAIAAMLPANIIWGNTTAVESVSSFLVSSGFLVLLISHRLGYPIRSLGLLALVLAMALQFRAETIVLFFDQMAIVIYALRSSHIKDGTRKALWFAGLGSLLVAVHCLHMAVISVEYDPTMGNGIGFDFQYIAANLRINSLYFISSPVMCLATALFAIGLYSGFHRYEVWIASGLFAFYFCLFLPYFVGSYALPGLQRYVVPGLDAYALLAAYGGDRLLHWGPLPRYRFAPMMLILVILVAGTVSLPIDLQFWHKAIEPAAQERVFIEACAANLPVDALIISQIPSVFANMGQSAITYASLPEMVKAGIMERYVGRIFMYSGLLPADMTLGEAVLRGPTEPNLVVVCQKQLAEYHLVLYRVQYQ